jgi:ankyrin repeat protein
MLAAAGGHAGTAKLLLENRACVDTMDSGRNTALMYAIAGGRNEAAKILIEKGARFDYISRLGFSPLDLAAHEKNEELISLMTRTASAPGGS